MKIVLPLNSVRLQLKSASESIQPVLTIWAGLIKSDWVQLMKYTVTEPGLLEVKTTIALPFRSRLVRLTTWIVRWRQKICQKECCTFRVFFCFIINWSFPTQNNSRYPTFSLWTDDNWLKTCDENDGWAGTNRKTRICWKLAAITGWLTLRPR